MLGALPHYRVLPGFLDRTERLELETLAAAADGWQPGRQGGGYRKLPLGPSALVDRLTVRSRALCEGLRIVGSDRYLLWYPRGVGIPAHRDPALADGRAHLRLNALVSLDGPPGRLRLAGRPVVLDPGDAVLFRPDLLVHEVVPADGTRLLWSWGCNVDR